MTREYTCKLFDAMESGAISATAIADMALAFMSEDDVKEMCQMNDLFINDEEDDDEG